MDQIKNLLDQLRRNPIRADLHNSLGRLYQQRGDTSEAVKHFLAAARLFAGHDSPARNVNKAMALLRKMIRDFPSHHDSYYLLAEILQEMDNQEEAIEVYKALSDLYRRDKKHLMAVSVFDKAIAANPDDQETWIRFAELNRDAGMPFHAAQAFVKAAAIGLETRKGEPPAGIVVEALKLDPENTEAYELFKNLSKRGETGEKQERDILNLANEVDRNGQYDQALVLLDLLKGTTIQDEAHRAITRIRGHLGFENETMDPAEESERRTLSRRFAGTKVLVVDDEKEILLLLEQILTGEGFQVYVASDGETGLEVYLRERPPLVVSDAMLPKLHGFELCRRIKEESSNAVKVMILTAVYKKYKYKGKVQEEYNVDEYLDKPFQITEFLQSIYKMAEGISESAQEIIASVPEPADRVSDELTFMLAAGDDRDTASKVTAYCERNGFTLLRAGKPMDYVDMLEQEVPDILFIAEPFPGLDADLAAYIVRGIFNNQWTTVVMITKDRSRMESPLEEFDHRIIAPVDNPVLDNIVNLHRSSHGPSENRRERAGKPDERRIEAVVRSKVERILKSHSQLEEYYSTKVRELEEEVQRLREELAERENFGF
jgi:DNA-binding response OmpR family regulator